MTPSLEHRYGLREEHSPLLITRCAACTRERPKIESASPVRGIRCVSRVCALPSQAEGEHNRMGSPDTVTASEVILGHHSHSYPI